MNERNRPAASTTARHFWMSAVASALVFTLPAASWADAESCLDCHAPADLKGAKAETVLEVLQAPRPRAHRRYAKLTREEVKAILAALAARREDAPE